MPYLLATAEQQQEMLAAIGVRSLEDLFAMVPADCRLGRDLQLPPALGELELTSHLNHLAARNHAASCTACFLGAGCYDHFVPAVVDFVAGRSEFYTAYTPYQAEASQGTLQAMFEYQTLVTQLTGMDVSNASVYDGATAAAEAVLMAIHASGRSRQVILGGAVHPEYRRVIATYLANLPTTITTLGAASGGVAIEELAAAIDDQTSCVLIQHPNFFGCLEEVEAIAEIVHRAGAALIVAVDPIGLGLLKRPGECGADIVVAEGQPLGIPLSFGGPYLGILACREAFVRRMPGRLVGQTRDRHGRRCWVLTLQTREQHIRREKATSNICTNQGLLALRASVYLATVGPRGLAQVAELCLQKAHYAHQQLLAGGWRAAFSRPFFKEFVVRTPGRAVEPLVEESLKRNLLAGVPMGRWYPELSDGLLVAVTEKRTRGEIDALAAALGENPEGRDA